MLCANSLLLSRVNLVVCEFAVRNVHRGYFSFVLQNGGTTPLRERAACSRQSLFVDLPQLAT